MGYKAKFSPRFFRSKCKPSPLPCLSWDGVGGVGQRWFRILHKSGIDSPILWRSPGLSSVRVCWDCWQYGRSAWALVLSGVQAGRRSFTVIFWPFLSFPSLPSLCPLPSISWAALALGSGWLGDCIGWGGLVSLCPHAGLGCCAGFLGCRRWPLSSPCLASSPSPGCCLWALVLLSPSVLSPGFWRSSAVLWCWPAMRWGWVLALGGVGAGVVQAVAVVAGWGWWVVIWRAWDSSCCTNTLLQIWLLFKGKAINFERFFLDIAHKVRYNNTRVKEIVNPLQLTASPSAGRRTDGRKEPANQPERRSAK